MCENKTMPYFRFVMSVTKALVWAAVAVLVIIYVRDAYRTPDRVEVLQTSVARFRLEMLRERQPIVLHESVQDVHQLARAWFRMHRTRRFRLDKGDAQRPAWVRSPYKFLLLWPQEDTELLLFPARGKMLAGEPDPSQELLAMQLRSHQVVILPFHWRYLLPASHVEAVGVHNVLTVLLP